MSSRRDRAMANRGVGVVQPAVMVSVAMREIEHLSPAEQDSFIALLGKRMESDLGVFVGLSRPIGDLVYDVQGPFADPLQGSIYVHTLTGNWVRDSLPDNCEAYRQFIQGNLPERAAPTEFAPGHE